MAALLNPMVDRSRPGAAADEWEIETSRDGSSGLGKARPRRLRLYRKIKHQSTHKAHRNGAIANDAIVVVL